MAQRRKHIPIDVRLRVLHEAGYKCGNPNCRNIITLDVHHIVYVSIGGKDVPENLLPLCPYCHDSHHKGIIPHESIRAWKMLLLALNEAFPRSEVDILLALTQMEPHAFIKRLSGDGILRAASLIAASLVEVEEYWEGTSGKYALSYRLQLSEKGTLFVEGWKKGNQQVAISALQPQTAKIDKKVNKEED